MKRATFSCFYFISMLTAISTYGQHSISVRSGVSFPVGVFARTNYGNFKAFAKPGTFIGGEYKVDIKSKISLVGDVSWFHFPYNERKAESYDRQYGTRFSSTNYNFWMATIGPVWNLGETGKIKWSARGLIGFAHEKGSRARYYEEKTFASVEEFFASAVNGFTYRTGINLDTSLSKRIKINGAIDYLHCTFHPMTSVVVRSNSVFPSKIRQDVSAFCFSFAATYTF